MSGGAAVPFDAAVRDLLQGGYAARFRASGDSMHPAIASGEFVQIEPCEAGTVRAGDIVLVDATRGLTVHRVVRLRRHAGELWVTTRGDNALWNDPPLPVSAVLGRVTGIERKGSVALPDSGGLAMVRLAMAAMRRMSRALRGRGQPP